MGCQYGARAVHQGILDQPLTKNLRTFVVWIPMLGTDERTDAVAASAQFSGLSQFWDGDKLAGNEVGASLGSNRTAWDIYLFYPPGVTWTDHLPPPDTVLAQTQGMVVANKGKLPPLPDQSALSGKLAEAGEIVGSPDKLPALLGEVAQRFTR